MWNPPLPIYANVHHFTLYGMLLGMHVMSSYCFKYIYNYYILYILQLCKQIGSTTYINFFPDSVKRMHRSECSAYLLLYILGSTLTPTYQFLWNSYKLLPFKFFYSSMIMRK